METKKFLQQVYNRINRQENPLVKLNDDCIEIFEGDKVIFKIDGKGSMFYAADKRLSGIVDKLHEEIQPIVCSVDEYLKAMENAPPLTARDFDMPYRKLAEFNGVVLGGTEHESTGEFEFATWDCRNNALYHGHYYNDYIKAKEDFAVRSGLVNENKLFTNKEMCEIYRCIDDTLSGVYELTDEQTEILYAVQRKTKASVENFDELIQQSNNQEYEQSM